MPTEYIIYGIVLVCCLLTTAQGVSALLGGVRFRRYVRRCLAEAPSLRTSDGRFRHQPRAVVILPCCGVDARLERTIHILGQQNYDDYEVIFAFESPLDPAFHVVGRWAQAWPRARWTRVVAGLAETRSQKVHNLLAAIGRIGADREVILFLDSDAVPDQDWIGNLVAPLEDARVGAATGFRWYPATGGLAAGIRSAWNAASISLLHDDATNFCWGGSTAIRRGTFEDLQIARRWDGALSDDYQLTSAIREAGLKIRFVPQALVRSADQTSLREFWCFARRQYIITRVCAHDIWRSGLILCLNLINGATCAFLLFLAAALGWIGDARVAVAACAGWLFILALAGAKALLRQLAVREVLRPADRSWSDVAWDVVGVGFIGGVHLWLLLASVGSRRFVWRNTEYEMLGPNQTRVLGRVSKHGGPAPLAAAAAPAPQQTP